MRSSIELRELQFYAYHGVSKLEQTVGCKFCISACLHLHLDGSALEDDQLEGTINYAEAYQTIKEEFSKPSSLIEHAAWRIIKALFARFERLEAIELTVEKLNPPMGADCRSAAVKLDVERNEIERNTLS